MQQPKDLTTLSQVMEKLRLKGIDNEITMDAEKKVISKKFDKTYAPEDLLIFKTYRFEGASDPDDNAVLYLLEDTGGNIGYIIDAYGAYSNHEGPEFDDFLKKIKVEDREGDDW